MDLYQSTLASKTHKNFINTNSVTKARKLNNILNHI